VPSIHSRPPWRLPERDVTPRAAWLSRRSLIRGLAAGGLAGGAGCEAGPLAELIELVRRQPKTLWSDLAGDEYDFAGDVRPDLPHPRWSQASERILPTGERVPTRMYNGYDRWVAGLYAG